MVVFARAPRLGCVKTRLAAALGAVAATRLYRHCLRCFMARLARDPRIALLLAVTPDGCAPQELRSFVPRGVRLLRQGRGDLGVRMRRVFARLPPGPAVILGSDIPDLAPRHIARAFAAMGGADVVLGPSVDGGYWLVGLRRVHPFAGLFDAVRWSTSHALADTLASVPARARVTLLKERLVDLDTAEDLCAWRAGGGELRVSGR